MNTDGFVSHEEFRAGMSPLANALTTYAEALRDQPHVNGHLPAAESLAMTELATEHRWSTADWMEPVRNAHSYGGMLTYLIAEHLSAYAAVISESRVGPAYAHMPTVRAVVEAVPIAHWMLDPSIGTERRVQRSITYRMHSLTQQKRMARLPGAVESAEDGLDRCKDYVSTQRWSLAGGIVGGQSVPKPTTYSSIALGAHAPDLDQAVWAIACGTHHANWWALSDGLAGQMQRDPLDPGGGVAAITAKSSQLAMFGVVLFQGADAVRRARAELMGWPETDAMLHCREALEANSRLIVEQLRHSDDDDV